MVIVSKEEKKKTILEKENAYKSEIRCVEIAAILFDEHTSKETSTIHHPCTSEVLPEIGQKMADVHPNQGGL